MHSTYWVNTLTSSNNNKSVQIWIKPEQRQSWTTTRIRERVREERETHRCGNQFGARTHTRTSVYLPKIKLGSSVTDGRKRSEGMSEREKFKLWRFAVVFCLFFFFICSYFMLCDYCHRRYCWCRSSSSSSLIVRIFCFFFLAQLSTLLASECFITTYGFAWSCAIDKPIYCSRSNYLA